MTRSSLPITEFIGREEELTFLRARLDQACAGAGGIVLLAGDPGIGKTRIAEELAIDAHLRGARVLWGHCHEGAGAPAYWPWVQIIRAYSRTRAPETLHTELGAGAADIAQIVPELRERLPELPPSPRLTTAQARFRLFDHITTFLALAAERQPLVLILDDLHWADEPSLLLLQFLARAPRSARLLVLGAYRDMEVGRAHPLARALADLIREPANQRLHLRGFGAPEVARFIEVIAGLEPAGDLIAAVTRETEGNPFFITEVVRLLLTEGRLGQAERATPWRPTLPRSVREVIGRRLARLSAPCNTVLTIAAVIGRGFSLALLQRAGQLAPEALLEALEEAETARVITAVANSPGQYTFSHALIRETLYEDLTTARRLRLHARVGEALEAIHGATATAPLGEIAHHLVQAASIGDAVKAVAYARRAAARAMERLAYEEAAGHYERALAALAAGPGGDSHEWCAIMLEHGDALRKAGEPHQALDTFARAAEVARRLKAPALLASAALGVEDVVLAAGMPRTAAMPSVRLLEEALEGLGTDQVATRARLQAALARALVFTGQPARGLALSQRAVALARQAGDRGALVYALDAHRIALWEPANLNERLAAASEIARLATEIGDREMALDGHLWRQNALVERGDIEAADAEIDIFERLAAELRQPLYRCYVPLLRASQALRAGQFAAAEHLAQQALDLGRQTGNENTAMIRVAQLLYLRREQGRIGEMAAPLADYARRLPMASTFHCALAFIACEEGRTAEASDLVETLTTDDLARLGRTFRLLNLTFLAETCATLGDSRHAAALYRSLLPYAAQHVLGSSAGPYLGSVARYLGLLAATLRRWEAAARHFESALDAHARVGASPWLARARHDYARLLLTRGRPTDRPRADDLLTLALDAARQMGMTDLATSVLRAREHLDQPRPGHAIPDGRPRSASDSGHAARYPDRLTEREAEILRRLASGESNRAMAAALSLSIRTVEHHVANIYTKIGAAGRVEATAYALRHGLALAQPERD
jgi:DNA-binding CsgD family transcriptional regulator